MIHEKAKPLLEHITAHPGQSITEIAAALGMTQHMVRDRLSSLAAAKAIHCRIRRNSHSLSVYYPGENPPERSVLNAKLISLPPCPFEIPRTDRSETAPRGPIIAVTGKDGAWLTKRAIGRWGG